LAELFLSSTGDRQAESEAAEPETLERQQTQKQLLNSVLDELYES
jgi:hypothetical protein